MEFFLTSKVFSVVYEHVFNANQLVKQEEVAEGGVVYFMDAEEADFFYKMAFEGSCEFVEVAFIISNSIHSKVYDEGLIIGSYRTFLKLHRQTYWKKIYNLALINKNFLDFTLDSWGEEYEDEKYLQLLAMCDR